MLYECIECHRIWCSADKFSTLNFADIDLETCMEISHGICPECFQRHEEKVHRHQKKNGYPECFNRNDDCDNYECLFKAVCGNSAIISWKSSVVILNVQNLGSD